MNAEMNDSQPAHTDDHRHAAASDTRYTCPMHPEIVRDAPGSCPKCGMTLMPMHEAIPRKLMAGS